MTRLEALKELAKKVEAGEWDHSPSGCARAVFPYRSASIDDLGLTALGAFNGSLDAAKALHEAVLPGWTWGVSTTGARVELDAPDWLYENYGDNEIPSRAWLLAILKTLIAQEESA